MNDVIAIYDTLVAIRTAADHLKMDLSRAERELEENLRDALWLLPQDEREETIESLDEQYDGLARGELEALL